MSGFSCQHFVPKVKMPSRGRSILTFENAITFQRIGNYAFQFRCMLLLGIRTPQGTCFVSLCLWSKYWWTRKGRRHFVTFFAAVRKTEMLYQIYYTTVLRDITRRGIQEFFPGVFRLCPVTGTTPEKGIIRTLSSEYLSWVLRWMLRCGHKK